MNEPLATHDEENDYDTSFSDVDSEELNSDHNIDSKYQNLNVTDVVRLDSKTSNIEGLIHAEKSDLADMERKRKQMDDMIKLKKRKLESLHHQLNQQNGIRNGTLDSRSKGFLDHMIRYDKHRRNTSVLTNLVENDGDNLNELLKEVPVEDDEQFPSNDCIEDIKQCIDSLDKYLPPELRNMPIYNVAFIASMKFKSGAPMQMGFRFDKFTQKCVEINLRIARALSNTTNISIVNLQDYKQRLNEHYNTYRNLYHMMNAYRSIRTYDREDPNINANTFFDIR